MELKLSAMNPGEKCLIKKVTGSGSLHRRMLDMGIVPRTEIEVIRRAPLGDPVEIRLKGYDLSLRKSEAEKILVEVIT